MTDFETHPVGTAARIAELTAAQKYRYIGKDGKPVLARELEDRIEQLEADADMMFARGMSHGQQVLKDTRRLVIVDSPELVELREALTRANAATAAAYEVAARVLDDCGDRIANDALGKQLCCDGYVCGCCGVDVGAWLQHLIRALATPDQTAAMNKLIAEAKVDALSGPWEDKPDAMTATVEASYPHITKDYDTYTQALELVSSRHSKGALVALVNHLLAASKKGGV